MTAILGGLGAALCWSCSALCATSASRTMGGASTLAWIMTLGLAMVLVPIAVLGDVSQLSSRVVLLLAIAGFSNVIGLVFQYEAYQLGKVAVVTAITSTEGMAATLIAVIAGQHVPTTVFLLLVFISVGIVMAAVHDDAAAHGATSDTKRLVFFSTMPALLFGVNLFAAGELGPHVSLVWAILPSRLVGAVVIALPLLLRRELRLQRSVFPLVLAAAAAEVVGYAAYVWGSRSELSIAAVLGSEFAAIATVGAYFLFHERLARRQIGGLAVVAVGIGVLAAIRG